jgi:hypothetical protein
MWMPAISSINSIGLLFWSLLWALGDFWNWYGQGFDPLSNHFRSLLIDDGTSKWRHP